jgi:hypothetical protein
VADDDSKKSNSVLSTTGGDPLVVPESGESIRSRGSFDVDGAVCVCGRQTFFVGIAESGKPCPFCGSLLTGRCTGCSKWICIGCLERAAIKEREVRGVRLLAVVGMLS